MKFYKLFSATTLFIICLLLTYYFHIVFIDVNVVFYAAVGDGVIATVLIGVVLWVSRYFSIFNTFEKIQIVFIFILTGYAFAITVPTVIDRSLSFYILEKLHQRGGGIKLANFEEVFTKEYVKEHRLVDIRLTEQQESGTLVIQDGCVKLTNKGEKIVAFSRMFRKNLLPKHRLIMGKYSDDLTDPFRNSTAFVDYMCQ